MHSRWPRFLFFFFLSGATVFLMYLVLDSEVIQAGSIADEWGSAALYKIAKYIDSNPIAVVVFLGFLALAEILVALMYLTTPPSERMVRYSAGENEVLVNLDSLAASLQRTIESEEDIKMVRLKLRVPPGKTLHIHCSVRLVLEEQPDIPARVDQLTARIRTHFEQSLPLESKFTTSVELEIAPAHHSHPQQSPKQTRNQQPVGDDFNGPRYPVDQ